MGFMSVNVAGVSCPVNAETTNEGVVQSLADYLGIFAEIYNLSGDAASIIDEIENPSDPSKDYAAEMQQGVINLLDLAKNGIVGMGGQRHYLTFNMANSLDLFLRTLQSAGIDVDGIYNGSYTINVYDVQNWKNLIHGSDVLPKIIELINLFTSGNYDHTLQAFIELVYVKQGNEVLETSLEKLEQALSTTKDVLNTLNQLQSMRDSLARILEKSSIEEQSFWTDSIGFEAFESRLTSAASALYGTPVRAYVEAAEASARVPEFLSLYQALSAHIATLSALAPQLQSANQEDAGTLLGKIKSVYGGIRAMSAYLASVAGSAAPQLTTPKALLQFWVMDYNGLQNVPSQFEEGGFQRQLTYAITAGENLNDTQKEEVRRYLFVFEEYYKSAAAILNKITQILERIAQGIAR